MDVGSRSIKMVSHWYQIENPLPDSIIDGLIKTRNITDAAHDTTGGNSDHQGTSFYLPKYHYLYLKREK